MLRHRPGSSRRAALLAFLLAAGFAGPCLAADDPPAPGTYVWVDGHRLHLNCQGEGAPTVVFDAGLGGSSLDWALVQPDVAAFTRACTYDRAGYGWSDPGPLPRDSQNVVSDLEQLLGNGSVPAPYVLVGHSLGGLVAQYFARQNAERIAGLVLVDATHEEQFRRLKAAVTAGRTARRTLVMSHGSNQVHEGLPEEVRRLAGAFSARARSLVVLQSEASYLFKAGRPTAASGELPDVPLVVISHRELPARASPRDAILASSWMDMQRDLLALTTRSRHVIAASDDHYVHIREPRLVVDAVRSVVEQHRRERDGRAAARSPRK